MRPIKFAGYNKVLVAPPGWDKNRGECVDLHTYNSGGVSMSVWKPTWRERLRILFGDNIQLDVVSGETQPPAKVSVTTYGEMK